MYIYKHTETYINIKEVSHVVEVSFNQNIENNVLLPHTRTRTHTHTHTYITHTYITCNTLDDSIFQEMWVISPL